MEARREISRVRRLADEELLAGLSCVLGSSRQLLAMLVVHLGEVEERRLHLLAGHGTLFAYCTDRLRMSEDEAYRRIEVARLGRQFPVLLERLAAGRVSLSVAALLKARLTQVNHVALLDALTGKTVKQAREVLAAWFPRADVLASIRKVPDRRASAAHSKQDEQARSDTPSFERASDDIGRGDGSSSARASAPVSPGCVCASGSDAGQANATATQVPDGIDAGTLPAPGKTTEQTRYCRDGIDASKPRVAEAHGQFGSDARGVGLEARSPAPALLSATDESAARCAAPLASMASARTPPHGSRASAEVEPLSPGRYKVVFTADAALKRKLELARDLLRHSVPDGDLPAIIDRALDLLLARTLQRRFGKTARHRSPATGTDAASISNIDSQPAAHATTPVDSEPIDGEPVAAKTGSSEDEGRAPASNEANPPIEPDDAASLASAGTTEGASAGSALIDRCPSAGTNGGARLTSPRPATAHDSEAAPSAPGCTAPPGPAAAPRDHHTRHLPSATRRAVLERDGLRRTWVSPDGVRCESRAWLEYDHIKPRGLGGGDEPSNLRIRCRAHNHLAAEHAYGQPAIERIIVRRRAPVRPA